MLHGKTHERKADARHFAVIAQEGGIQRRATDGAQHGYRLRGQFLAQGGGQSRGHGGDHPLQGRTGQGQTRREERGVHPVIGGQGAAGGKNLQTGGAHARLIRVKAGFHSLGADGAQDDGDRDRQLSDGCNKPPCPACRPGGHNSHHGAAPARLTAKARKAMRRHECGRCDTFDLGLQARGQEGQLLFHAAAKLVHKRHHGAIGPLGGTRKGRDIAVKVRAWQGGQVCGHKGNVAPVAPPCKMMAVNNPKRDRLGIRPRSPWSPGQQPPPKPQF